MIIWGKKELKRVLKGQRYLCLTVWACRVAQTISILEHYCLIIWDCGEEFLTSIEKQKCWPNREGVHQPKEFLRAFRLNTWYTSATRRIGPEPPLCLPLGGTVDLNISHGKRIKLSSGLAHASVGCIGLHVLSQQSLCGSWFPTMPPYSWDL